VRVIADRAYNSDPLRNRLRQRGIELICTPKKNRVRPATQDGRALRQYGDSDLCGSLRAPIPRAGLLPEMQNKGGQFELSIRRSSILR
jgi:hypothetical protein